MDPKTEKLVRRTTMIATLTAAYFLLTEDYGQNPNALDPPQHTQCVLATTYDPHFQQVIQGPILNLVMIKRAIKSAEMSVKKFFNSGKDTQENSNDAKEKS